jgi:hypothetical protein
VLSLVVDKEQLAIPFDEGLDGPAELCLQGSLVLLARGNLPCLLLLDNLLGQLEEESNLVADKINHSPFVATGLGGASQNEGLLQILK